MCARAGERWYKGGGGAGHGAGHVTGGLVGEGPPGGNGWGLAPFWGQCEGCRITRTICVSEAIFNVTLRRKKKKFSPNFSTSL